MTELELRQQFKNLSNCYTDVWTDEDFTVRDGAILQAMTEDRFIETLKQVKLFAMPVVIKWVAVKDNPPPKAGIFIIYDNGIGQGLYNKKTKEWKSIDRPIKNATGAKVLRQTIKPLYWLDLKPPYL